MTPERPDGEAAVEGEPEAGAPPAPPVAGAARILVVDDDPDLREVISTRLLSAGYRVLEAGDGREALARARAEPVDLVLLDVKMPGMTGFEVLERMQAEGEPHPLPHVIFLTAMGTLRDRVAGLERGAVDYIVKPFAPEELLARVAAAVRLRQELAAARVASYVDELTGLGNRREFERSLAAELARARRYRHGLALVYLDADGLKEVNDRFGHPAGDELLRGIARALRATGRGSDRAARIGGDEFAVVLPRAGREEARAFAERLRAALARESVAVGGEARPLRASIGCAAWPEDGEEEEALKHAADAALYREKAARRREEPPTPAP